VKNSFINQFSQNIKFNYTCFDRVIIRDYILKFFSLACVVLFLRAMGFSRKSTGIMRIFTDQLNSHISNQAAKLNAQIFWWPSIDGGVNGAKLRFVGKIYADSFSGRGNHVFCTCHRWKYVPMLFLDQPNFAPVSLKDFWINSRVSDCPTPLLKYSPGGLPAHIPNLSGDCMTTTPVSNTGSGKMPSSSTIKPVITLGLKPPSTTPSRWGFKNLSSFYRPVCGLVSDTMTVC